MQELIRRIQKDERAVKENKNLIYFCVYCCTNDVNKFPRTRAHICTSCYGLKRKIRLGLPIRIDKPKVHCTRCGTEDTRFFGRHPSNFSRCNLCRTNKTKRCALCNRRRADIGNPSYATRKLCADCCQKEDRPPYESACTKCFRTTKETKFYTRKMWSKKNKKFSIYWRTRCAACS